MSISAFSGPVVSYAQPALDYNPEMATSLFWGGSGILDPRNVFTYEPGQNFGNWTLGWLGTNNILTVYAPPVTKSNTIIAGAAHTTAGTAMTLASSTTAGLAVGVSVPRMDTNATVTGLLELDPLTMSSTANVTSGSNVLTVTAMGTGSGNHPIGICIGMVLTDATTAANIPAGTSIIGYGTGNGGVGTYIMSANATATATGDTVTGLYTAFPHAQPEGSAATVLMWNPMAMLARAVSVTSTTSQVDAATFTINGLDIYGFPMTEVITLSGTTATTTNGKKAFKYIKSVTPNTTDGTGNYSIGTLDIFGLPIRSDKYQVGMCVDVSMMMNNALITSATGYVAGVETSPATASTGDVRGTYATQTGANGTLLLGVNQSPFNNNLQSVTGLYGVSQYSAW